MFKTVYYLLRSNYSEFTAGRRTCATVPAGIIFSPRCVHTRRLENTRVSCILANSLKTRKRQTLEQDECSCTPPNFCRAECLRCCLDVHVVVAVGGPSALISSLERSYMPLEPSIRLSNGAVNGTYRSHLQNLVHTSLTRHIQNRKERGYVLKLAQKTHLHRL